MKIAKQENIKSNVALDFVNAVPTKGYGTILADPPWRFSNRTGKVAPEHKRLNRYDTLSLEEIMEMEREAYKPVKVEVYTSERKSLHNKQ